MFFSVPTREPWQAAPPNPSLEPTCTGVALAPQLKRELVRLIGYPFSLDISRARSVLGYSPEVTIEQGMAPCSRQQFAGNTIKHVFIGNH